MQAFMSTCSYIKAMNLSVGGFHILTWCLLRLCEVEVSHYPHPDYVHLEPNTNSLLVHGT